MPPVEIVLTECSAPLEAAEYAVALLPELLLSLVTR